MADRAQRRRAGWRLATLLLTLSIATTAGASALARALVPLFRAETAWISAPFEVRSLQVTRDGPSVVFMLRAELRGPVELGGHLVAAPPGTTSWASTVVTNVTLPAVLLLSLALAWPAGNARAEGARAVLALLAVLALWSIDIPPTLSAALWGLLVDAAEPGRWSGLLAWEHFLHNGGRLALAVAAGLAVARVRPAAGGSSGIHAIDTFALEHPASACDSTVEEPPSVTQCPRAP